jgi:transcriptional regulator with XRE-family HTH domain
VKRKRRLHKRKRLDGPIHGRIADLREKKGWTQDQLATAVGVDKTAVSHWETGIARPDQSRLPAVAGALDTTVDALLKGETAA